MPTALLFTGHMTDLPGRKTPRFPQSLADAAAAEIGAKIAAARGADGAMGFASLARGGDILFHEQSRRVGIETVVVLPFAPETFVETSVAGVPDSDWESRFWALWDDTPDDRREVLDLPKTDEAYARCNARLLERAQAFGEVALIALLSQESVALRGGAGDFVREIAEAAPETHIIDPKDLARNP